MLIYPVNARESTLELFRPRDSKSKFDLELFLTGRTTDILSNVDIQSFFSSVPFVRKLSGNPTSWIWILDKSSKRKYLNFMAVFSMDCETHFLSKNL
jgi:hypothetical protein